MLSAASHIIKALWSTLCRARAHASLRIIAALCLLIGSAAVLYPIFTKPSPQGGEIAASADAAQAALPIALNPVQVRDVVREGETLSVIFDRHRLSRDELALALEALRGSFNPAMLKIGRPYSITFDSSGSLISFVYEQPSGEKLSLRRDADGLKASIDKPQYEKRTAHVGGVIKDMLSSSVGGIELALSMSDVFAWDLDFATDLREGDTFRVVVETWSREGRVVGYGDILAAEFVNNGRSLRAYRFETSEGPEYFDAEGNSLKRSFLKAPLSYRRISSGFSTGRFHPVLKIFRSHYAIDYAASAGTPVSAVGDGTVAFAGFKGQNGNMVSIRHGGGFATSYGHLQKIASGIRSGSPVKQGQLIGWVGSTGLATGPHLDYRVTQSGRPVNPLKLHSPRGKSVPQAMMAEFSVLRDGMDARLASIETGADGLAVLAAPALKSASPR